jgi:ArsR family transcriptional regulator
MMTIVVSVNPPLETVFAALADRTRLRLLNLMSGGEVCVCFFVEILGEPQPKVSRHLAYLRQAGLVEPRRDGKWIHYRLADRLPRSAQPIIESALRSFGEDVEMRRDRAALRKACCASKLPEALQHAPRPSVAGE